METVPWSCLFGNRHAGVLETALSEGPSAAELRRPGSRPQWRSEGSHETRNVGVLAEGQEELGENNEFGMAEAHKIRGMNWKVVNGSRGESCSRLVRLRKVWSLPLKKIYVGNLSFDTTEQGVGAAFTAFGAVHSVAIVRDRHTGEPRGFGFVEMESSDEADSAIAALNGTALDGRTVAVSEARSRAVKNG
jgi:hypothetical protein